MDISLHLDTITDLVLGVKEERIMELMLIIYTSTLWETEDTQYFWKSGFTDSIYQQLWIKWAIQMNLK